MKTTGELEIWARRMALRFLLGTIIAMAIVSAWVPFLGLKIEARWFSWPNIAFLWPVPLVTAYTAWRIYRSLEEGGHYRPFLLTIALFLLGYLGLGISLFPYIVPPDVTIWQAANTPKSQAFTLVGLRHRDAADAGLHRLFVLGLPRQSAGGRAGGGLPLTPGARRVAWFAALYIASLAAFTALVYAFRAIVPH
jgi:hypothetical protein